MDTVRISEAELLQDASAAMRKVREGVAVVIYDERSDVAVVRPAVRIGRPLSESINRADAYEAKHGTPVPDEDFASDVRLARDEFEASYVPPSWD